MTEPWWYHIRQQRMFHQWPKCTCGGLLDYVYGNWWQCRACANWVKRW